MDRAKEVLASTPDVPSLQRQLADAVAELEKWRTGTFAVLAKGGQK
jgi:hypothetical protein